MANSPTTKLPKNDEKSSLPIRTSTKKSNPHKKKSHSSKKAHGGSLTEDTSPNKNSSHSHGQDSHAQEYSYDHSLETQEPVERYMQEPREYQSWTTEVYDAYQQSGQELHQGELESVLGWEY